MVDDSRLAKDKNYQRVIIVADSEKQRRAFVDTIEKLDLTLVACIDAKSLTAINVEGKQLEKDTLHQADIWLVDSCYDDQLYRVLEYMSDGLMLVGFEQAPEPANVSHYSKWQRRLSRKINQIIKRPLISDSQTTAKKYQPWQHVVLLGASKQDLMSLSVFFDLLPSSLPVVILLVHDLTEPEVYNLPQKLSQHNQWQVQVISLSMNMQAGHCYLVPPRLKVVFDSTGRAILVPKDEAKHGGEDEAPYQLQSPNLAQILENCSDVFGDQLIAILFSYAVLNTALNVEKIRQNRSQIWLQNDFRITNPSLTESMLELSQHTGTPTELAQYLLDYLA